MKTIKKNLNPTGKTTITIITKVKIITLKKILKTKIKIGTKEKTSNLSLKVKTKIKVRIRSLMKQ